LVSIHCFSSWKLEFAKETLNERLLTITKNKLPASSSILVAGSKPLNRLDLQGKYPSTNGFKHGSQIGWYLEMKRDERENKGLQVLHEVIENS
jgi:hypothetical protein